MNMDTIEKIKGGKIYVKPFNYICGLACIGCGVLALLGGYRYNLYTYCVPFYFAFFGLIMIASDLNIHLIVESCNFLDIYMGRGLFNIFVGSQVIDQAKYAGNAANDLAFASLFLYFGEIVGYAIVFLGVYLIILHCLESNTSINGIIRNQITKAVIGR